MNLVAAGFGPGDPAWLAPVVAAAIVVFSWLVAFLFFKLAVPLALRIAHHTPTDLDSRLVQTTKWPVTFGIMVLGLYLALTVPLDLGQAAQHWIGTVARVMAIIFGIMFVVGLVSQFLDWHLENLSTRTSNVIDVRFFPLLRRLAVVIIYGLGVLLVLDVLQINISPLIAGLGIGGLAVALAIQPTLSNLFAGTYVMTEGVISTGDYIELDGGPSGYVVGVGWRSTRIRTWSNNLVVIPNARLADTIITNYHEPTPPVNLHLVCGVSYDSDLQRVEEVSREVMERLLDTDGNAVKEYGAWFGYDSFADSNVNFWLFLQARNRLAGFDLQSSLIRDLHRRFAEEGIVINYPVRTLHFPDGTSQEPWWLREASRAAEPPAGRRPAGRPPAEGPGGEVDGPDF